MKKTNSIFLAIFVVIMTSACSTVNKIGVNSTSSLLLQVSDSVKEQNNFEFVKEAMGPNLLLMESLLSASSENKNLLATLTKGYAGYAFLANETDMMVEEFANLKSEKAKNQAMINYSKAIDFGLKYLAQYEISYDDLMRKMNETQGIILLLDDKLSNNRMNQEVVMFTAQALIGLINLKKDDFLLISQIPIAKAMFDWTCLKNPSIEYGMCDIFNGAYEASRPEMLGGNPKRGKEIFLRAIENHPHNWQIRMSYIQYYLIPNHDEEGFKEQMDHLAILSDEFKSRQIFRGIEAGENAKKPDWAMENRLRLYQALAIKRFDILKQYKSQIF